MDNIINNPDINSTLTFPDVPCQDYTNLILWKQFLTDANQVGQDNDLRKTLLECTFQQTECFRPEKGVCNLDQLNRSQNADEDPMIDLSAELLEQSQCIKCIMSGNCQKYQTFFLKMSCFIRALFTSRVYIETSDNNIKTFLILIIEYCCGNLSISQRQQIESSIRNIDVTSLYAVIRDIIATYLTPGTTSTSSDNDNKSWFEKNRGMAIFLILFFSSLVLLVVFGVVHFRNLPATTSRTLRNISRVGEGIPHSRFIQEFNVDDLLNSKV